MEKKKLAIFVNSLARAGAEKVVVLLLQQLRKDFDIHLLLFDKQTIEFDVPEDITIVQVGRFKNPARATLLFNIFLNAPFVKKYLQAHNIPLLLSFLSRPALTAGVVKGLGWKGSLVICERTMTSAYYSNTSLMGKIGRFLVKRLYKKADLIITNAKLNEQDLRKTFGFTNPITTIYNPVDIPAALPSVSIPTDLLPPNGDFVFCNIGRCDYYKNQQLLLHAFANMKQERCRLLIIGKDVPNKLSPLCKQLKLEDKVQLLDMRLEVYPYLKAVNTFVLSSIIEGFPNVVLEALACSLPVISTDCQSGPREILAPHTAYPASLSQIEEAEFGLLCQNNDAVMLAEAMDKMVSNPALAQGYAQKALGRANDFSLTNFEKEFRAAILPFYASTAASD